MSGTQFHPPTFYRTPSSVNPRTDSSHQLPSTVQLPPIVSTQATDRQNFITPIDAPLLQQDQPPSPSAAAPVRSHVPSLDLRSLSDFTGDFVSQPYGTPMTEFTFALATRPHSAAASALLERRKSFCFSVEKETLSSDGLPPYPSPLPLSDGPSKVSAVSTNE